jgi:2,4-dienoyl-CoA reductase-like NADH-dependent reductase (Old Yellow Enzyme family)/thioredoxin reductase
MPADREKPIDELSHLRRTIMLGRVEVPNRVMSTAHQTTLVHDHLPTDDFVAYHEARARGGVGMIVMEATAVHRSGLLTPHTLGGFLPDIVKGYRRVAAAVRPRGTRLFVQLFHGGREQIASPPRAPAVAPSAVPSARFRTEPRGLRADEIEELVAGYGRAAALAAEGGLDGVELSAAHSYLIEQFADPGLNLRSDAWAEAHAFLLAVVGSVREAAPTLCLGVRLSADAAAAPAMAEALRGSVDYVSIALGRSSTYLGSVGIVPPPPVAENAIAAAAAPFRVGLPLLGATRVVDPEAAERLVADGTLDVVGMTRALIADPELALKSFGGRRDEIIRCTGCNACIAHYHAGTPIACASNPRTGRERTLKLPERTKRRKRILVAGGGPAGLAAAIEACRAGHAVTLCEKSSRLGGQAAVALGAPGSGAIARALIDDLERHATRLGVEIRLEAGAGTETVTELDPDAVVAATGAVPYLPGLPLSGVEVLQAWDVLGGTLPAGRAVVVADWGGDSSGLDAAELLAAAGKAVTLAVAAVSIGEGIHVYRRNLYLRRLYRAGVHLEHHVALQSATPGGAVFRNVFAPELELEIPCEGLVLALGRVPVAGLAESLVAQGVRVEEAGDCLSPRSFEEAILEGTLAARRVFA